MVKTIMNVTDIIEIEKTRNLTLQDNKVNASLPKYWDREYINQQIENTNNYEHKMLLTFLWYTGVRITEALSLKKRDIDFKNFFITIKWQKSRKYQTRVIPMHPLLAKILEIYTATKNVDETVFPITRQRAWQITQKRLGGNPHKFRHSFAVNWLKSGGDVVILSKMLGHARIQNTLIYLNLVPIDQGKELIKITFG
jgi:integrase/recombinase XerD